MKKIYTLCFALMMATATFAQGKLNIVIFSEDGEPFFAYVNGIRQNQSAETNIRITDLTTESFHFRIVFANSGNEPLTKNQYLPFGSEYTFKIKKAKKGMKLAPFGQVALAESTSTAPSYAFTTTENTGTTNNTQNSISPTNNTNTANTNATVTTTGGTTGTTTQTSETITTTTTVNSTEPVNTNTGTNGENVNFNMNVSENGMNVNMNVSGTTTGTTGTTGTNNATINVNGTGTNNASTNVNTTGTTTTTTTYSTTTTTSGTTGTTGTTGYDQSTYNTNTTNTNTNSNVGPNTNTSTTSTSSYCSYPMSDGDFNKMKTSVESKTYQDVMMTTAKQATKNNCLNVTQIGEVMNLFMMDEDKLAYAKYAYDYCTEKQNYYQLADVLTYSGTQEDFNSWLDKK